MEELIKESVWEQWDVLSPPGFPRRSQPFKRVKEPPGLCPYPVSVPLYGGAHPPALPAAWNPHLGGGGGPGGGASAELRLHSSDGGRGREDELRGQRNSAA